MATRLCNRNINLQSRWLFAWGIFWFVFCFLMCAWWNAKLQQAYYPVHCNSIVWAHCPQHKHYGTKVIHCAVAPAVCHFHSAAASRPRVMERLSVPARMFTKKASAEKDKRQLKKSDLQISAKEKKECSCCEPAEKRPSGRLSVIHMMQGGLLTDSNWQFHWNAT